jgi:membrane fusion protein (multidrug efflux system)
MSVRRATFGDHVFVLEPEKDDKGDVKPGMYRAKQRFISLGETIGARVIVTKGLSAGEKIAAEGSFKLREGILVMDGAAGNAGGPAGQPGNGPGTDAPSDAEGKN